MTLNDKDRLSKLEGELESFLLKSQKDDKKLDSIHILREDMEKTIIWICEESKKTLAEISNQKQLVNSVSVQLSNIVNAFENIEKTCFKKDSHEKYQTSLAQEVLIINEKLSIFGKSFVSLESKQNEFEKAIQVLVKDLYSNNKIFDRLNSSIEILSDKVSVLEHVLTSKEIEIEDIIRKISEHDKIEPSIEKKLFDSYYKTEEFKKSVAESLSLAFKIQEEKISNILNDYKPVDHKKDISSINSFLETVKQENELYDEKHNVTEKEINVIRMKIDKLFLLVKKIELGKE